MTDKPILFSGPMVRALLAGTKTQTRRVIPGKMQDAYYEYDDWCSNVSAGVPTSRQWEREFFLERLRIAVDDRLYVREAWRCNGWATDVATIMYRASEGDGYTAMTEQYPVAGKDYLRVTGTWRPGIHMPRWASRIWLTVTDVRVERLQDISEADAIAEGASLAIDDRFMGGPLVHTDVPNVYATPRNWYRELWDSINGPGAWDKNPWVAAYTFTVHMGNIDGAAS